MPVLIQSWGSQAGADCCSFSSLCWMIFGASVALATVMRATAEPSGSFQRQGTSNWSLHLPGSLAALLPETPATCRCPQDRGVSGASFTREAGQTCRVGANDRRATSWQGGRATSAVLVGSIGNLFLFFIFFSGQCKTQGFKPWSWVVWEGEACSHMDGAPFWESHVGDRTQPRSQPCILVTVATVERTFSCPGPSPSQKQAVGLGGFHGPV